MKTDIYFAKKDGMLLIAYQNHKKQNVFLQVVYADSAPQIRAQLICDSNYNIEKVIQNAYEYPRFKNKNKKKGNKKLFIKWIKERRN